MAGAYLAALLTLPAAFALLQTPGLPRLHRRRPTRAVLLDPDRRRVLRLAGGSRRSAADAHLDSRDPDLDLRIPDRRLQRRRQLGPGNRREQRAAGLRRRPASGRPAFGRGAAIVIALAYKWSASGYRLQATREDEVAARSIGIGVMRERLPAFALSGVLCGVGGALAVHQSGRPQPHHLLLRRDRDDADDAGRRRNPQRLRRRGRGNRGSTVTEVLRGFEDGASLFGAGLNRRYPRSWPRSVSA